MPYAPSATANASWLEPIAVFETIVGDTQVSEDVVWAKLEAMRDGAAIASKRPPWG